MRGDRFPPLQYRDMTPAQKTMADRALAGRGAIGDFNIVLRSPELAAVLRSAPRTAISTKQSELAILISARYWTTQFEWAVHHRADDTRAEPAGVELAMERLKLLDGSHPAR